jgi:hypothetical protein
MKLLASTLPKHPAASGRRSARKRRGNFIDMRTALAASNTIHFETVYTDHTYVTKTRSSDASVSRENLSNTDRYAKMAGLMLS